MRRTRLGIIGNGMIAKAFIEEACHHPAFHLVGIYSRSTASHIGATVLRRQLRAYASVNGMMDDNEIDAAIICTPHALHAEHAIQCILAGKDALIEKPLATSLSELGRLEQCASNTDAIVVALRHQEYPYELKAIELIDQGAIGPITEVHSYLDVPGPPRSNWYYSAAARGGASLDTLPYALSRALSVCRTNVSTGLFFSNRLIAHRQCLDGGRVDVEVDDTATVLLKLQTGQQLIVRSSWNVAEPEDYLILNGRLGQVKVDCWRNTVEIKGRAIDTIARPKGAPPTERLELEKVSPERLKLDVFARHIANRSSNLPRSAHIMRIILAGLQSNQERVFSLPIEDYSAVPKVMKIEGYL